MARGKPAPNPGNGNLVFRGESPRPSTPHPAHLPPPPCGAAGAGPTRGSIGARRRVAAACDARLQEIDPELRRLRGEGAAEPPVLGRPCPPAPGQAAALPPAGSPQFMR